MFAGLNILGFLQKSGGAILMAVTGVLGLLGIVRFVQEKAIAELNLKNLRDSVNNIKKMKKMKEDYEREINDIDPDELLMRMLRNGETRPEQ